MKPRKLTVSSRRNGCVARHEYGTAV